MELWRKAYDKLLQWKKESNGTSAILIEGARQMIKCCNKRRGEINV